MVYIDPVKLAEMSKTLAGIKEKALGIKEQIGTLAEAKKAGMTITPQTSTEEAQRFLGTAPSVSPTPPVAGGYEYGGGAGGMSGTEQAIMDYLANLQGQQTSYMSTLQEMASPEDLFELYREKLGMGEQESELKAKTADLQATNIEIQKTQAMLDDLERNIQARTQGKLITEPIAQRQLAIEQRPITEKLRELGRILGIQQAEVTGAEAGLSTSRENLSQMLQLGMAGQERQAQIAGMPLEFGTQMLPTISAMAQYQSPEEEYAQWLQQQQAAAQIQQEAVGTWSEPYQLGGDWVQKNSKTGEIRTAVNVPVSKGTDEEKKIIDEFNKALTAPKEIEIAQEGFRERLLQKLRTLYPQIDPDDISRAVYEYYTDEYIEQLKKIGG